MNIQSAFPINNKDQLIHWLRATLPRYTYTTRAGVVIVGSGVSTGVMIKSNGPHHGSLGWAFPSMAVQMLLTLTVLLTGILPGLLLWLFVWLAVKGDVEKLKLDLAQHLATGGAQQPQQQQWGGQEAYGAPQLQQGYPQQGYDPQQGAPQMQQGYAQPAAPQLQQGYPQQGAPQLQQGMPPQQQQQQPQQGGMAPGSQVMVATPDGQQHPATLVQEAQGQCQCRFQNGHEQWYPSASVRPA